MFLNLNFFFFATWKKREKKKYSKSISTKDTPRAPAYKIVVRLSNGWWNTIQLSKLFVLICPKTYAQTFPSQTMWCRDMVRSFCMNSWIISNPIVQWSNWDVPLKCLHGHFLYEQCHGEIWFNLFAWILE